jgi:tetratricopeptide (TPR) repeat protein
MQADELPLAIHDLITRSCADGDRLAELGDYEAAIGEYNKAWALVPEPKNRWNASTWILAAIADAAWLGGFRTSAREALDYAMTCPDAIGNPFLHLRRGQVLFEQDEIDAASDELMRAYMGAGAEIFANEDAKYLQFLGTRAELD